MCVHPNLRKKAAAVYVRSVRSWAEGQLARRGADEGDWEITEILL